MTCTRRGCTDFMACLMPDGSPCAWAEPGPCTRCAEHRSLFDRFLDAVADPFMRLLAWVLVALLLLVFGVPFVIDAAGRL